MKAEILKACFDLSDDEFSRVVRSACHGATKLPSAADYLKHARPIIKKKRDESQKEKLARLDDSACKCPWCGNYGTIYANKRGEPYEFIFQCHRCECSALRGATSYPRWDEELYGSQYELKPFKPALCGLDPLREDAP